jgi:hypothetical protein
VQQTTPYSPSLLISCSVTAEEADSAKIIAVQEQAEQFLKELKID